MVASKKEWVCNNCGVKYIKWDGKCFRGCGFSGTLEEVILKAGTTKYSGTTEAKRLRRRAKDSERDIAKRMLSADGADPNFRNIASSTGRIGHITGMRVDAVSLSYVTENKNRKIPTWMVQAWLLINQKSFDFNKHALLHIDPPNAPKTYPSQGGTRKLDTMAVITQTRHEELIQSEKILAEIMKEVGKHKEFETLETLYLALLQRQGS